MERRARTQRGAAGARARTQVETHRLRHTLRWRLPVPLKMTMAQKHAPAAMIINVAGSHCLGFFWFMVLGLRPTATGQPKRARSKQTHERHIRGSPSAHVRRPIAPGSLRVHQLHPPAPSPFCSSCTSRDARGLPYLENPLTREKARSSSACSPSASAIRPPLLPPHREPSTGHVDVPVRLRYEPAHFYFFKSASVSSDRRCSLQ